MLPLQAPGAAVPRGRGGAPPGGEGGAPELGGDGSSKVEGDCGGVRGEVAREERIH